VDDGYDVRFRIDGSLVDTVRLPQEQGLALVRAFKTNADLDPASRFRPQDGRVVFPVEGKDVSVLEKSWLCVYCHMPSRGLCSINSD
jgi:type II secretory ATPase GspE/PulE/Tfp pilus assembly ATPase PilB-like protein